MKLFPAEGVTLAPLIQPIAQGDSVLTLVLVAAVVLLIILLRRVPNEPQGGGATDWLAIGVAVVSFLLYAATLRIFGLFLNPPERHTLLMSFITIVWVAAVPLIPQRR